LNAIVTVLNIPTPVHHRLRGSASPVLTATGFVNGRGQYLLPPQNPHPLTNHQKKSLLEITTATPTAVPNLVQIRPRGLLGKWVKYNELYLFIYLHVLHELTYRSDPPTDFHAWWLKRRGLAHGCAFWGCR